MRRELFERVDWGRVRIYDGGRAERGVGKWMRRVVLVASGGRAVALGNRVFIPDRLRGDVALLAHELTHCAQYQAWGAWRYFARGAREQLRDLLYRSLGIGASPYRYTIERSKPLHAYGMEQQAQIIEDQIRCSPRSPPTGPERSRQDPRSSP